MSHHPRLEERDRGQDNDGATILRFGLGVRVAVEYFLSATCEISEGPNQWEETLRQNQVPRRRQHRPRYPVTEATKRR